MNNKKHKEIIKLDSKMYKKVMKLALLNNKMMDKITDMEIDDEDESPKRRKMLNKRYEKLRKKIVRIFKMYKKEFRKLNKEERKRIEKYIENNGISIGER